MREPAATFLAILTSCWRSVSLQLISRKDPEMKVVHFLSLAAALLLAVNKASADETPLELVQTIPFSGVTGNLDHLAVDAKGMRLFVANKANNTLDVIDLKAGKPVHQVPDQVKVSGVAYAADLDMIYVGNGGGVCNGIDGKEYKVVFSTKAEKADNVYYHSGNKTVYVAHGETISVLDAKTGEVKAQISTGGKTEEFRVDKKANKLYVNLKPSVIAVIDLLKNEVVDRFKLTMTESNGPLAYDSKAGLLFVGCGGKAPMILVVDAKTGKEMANVEIPGGIDNLHFDSKRSRLYASCGDGAGALAVIEKKGDKYELISKIETAKKAKTSIYNSSLGRLFVGVPKQEGKDGPEIRIFEARPIIEAKTDAGEKKGAQ
jgi:DNA-binding beta-propeller fold protein YncE